MLTDRLGRPIIKGQKVVFSFEGMLEADVIDVNEVAIATPGNKHPGKTLMLASVHPIDIPPGVIELPNVYIVMQPEEKAKLTLDSSEGKRSKK